MDLLNWTLATLAGVSPALTQAANDALDIGRQDEIVHRPDDAGTESSAQQDLSRAR